LCPIWIRSFENEHPRFFRRQRGRRFDSLRFLGLVVDEALTAIALCDPDNSPMSCVYWSLARRKLTWREQANARFQPRLAPIFGVLGGGRQPGHYTGFGVTSGWAVIRPRIRIRPSCKRFCKKSPGFVVWRNISTAFGVSPVDPFTRPLTTREGT
jgi:hypothetical protein